MDKQIEKPKAKYEGREVTVVYISSCFDYALISKNENLTQRFKVNVKDLEINSQNELLNFYMKIHKTAKGSI